VVSTLGKNPALPFLSSLAAPDTEARIYLNPEMARAADAPETDALWQLDLIPELGMCFPNTKTSNAMAFLNLRTACLPARRVLFMAGT
jgi:hypothetical protein